MITPLDNFHYPQRRDGEMETKRLGEGMDQSKRNSISSIFNNFERIEIIELIGDFFNIESMKPDNSVRVSKNSGQVSIEIDMPGSSKSDVSVDILESNILKIEWKNPRNETKRREFKVSQRADVKNIVATVADGMLTVTIPELPKPTDARRIEVK